MSQRGDVTFGMGGWWSVEVGGTRGSFCIENCVEKFTFYPSPGSKGAADPGQLDYFGGKSLVAQSHGQSMMSFFRTRYRIKGLYLMDEPETFPAVARALGVCDWLWHPRASLARKGVVARGSGRVHRAG